MNQADLRANDFKGDFLIVLGSECYYGGRNCWALSMGEQQKQTVRNIREWKSGRLPVGLM